MCFRTNHEFDRQDEPARLPETSVPPRVRRLVGAAIAALVAIVAAWTLPDMLSAKAASTQQRTSIAAAEPVQTSTPVVLAQHSTAMVDDEVPTAAGDKVSAHHCDH